jgi:hypothetical protein
MQFSNEKRKPNKCIINQKTKTYPTKQPKMKHLRKKLQIIQKIPLFLLQAYVNVKKKLQAYAKKIPFFSIAKEFHHLHKTMGQGTISPWYNERDEPTTTPKGSKW